MVQDQGRKHFIHRKKLFRFSGNKMEQNNQPANNQLLIKMCGIVFSKIRQPFDNTLGTNMLFSHIFPDNAAKTSVSGHLSRLYICYTSPPLGDLGVFSHG